MRSQELLRGFTGRRECSCVLSALVARVQETVLCWVLERRELALEMRSVGASLVQFESITRCFCAVCFARPG